MLNNSKMRLAAFWDYEALFSLSGVSLVRFFSLKKRNEHPRLSYPNTKHSHSSLFHFLATSCKKMEKRKAVQGGEGLRA